MTTDETIVVDQGRRRPLVILLAVLAGIVLAFLAWVFIISPLLVDEEDDLEPPVSGVTRTPSPGTTSPEPAPLASPDATEGFPIETVEIFLARDPFQPVRPTETPAAVPTDGTTPPPTTDGTTTGTTTTTGGFPGEGTTGTTTTGETTGETTGDGDGSAQVDGREVTLIDVFEDDGQPRAIVQVDSTSYNVGQGDTFAENFRVLGIDPPCVTLLFGDDAFSLCEGDRVLK